MKAQPEGLSLFLRIGTLIVVLMLISSSVFSWEDNEISWTLTGATIDNPPPSDELVLALGYINPSDECLAIFSNKGTQLTREEFCKTEGEVWTGIPVSEITELTKTVTLCDRNGKRCTPEIQVASFETLTQTLDTGPNTVGTRVGQIAPPIEGVDYNGTTVVHFWASWCGYCVPEIPVLLDYARDFPQVQFVFIDDEPKEDMDKFLAQYSLPTNVAVIHDPEGNIFYDWRVTGYPTTYVVSNGRIETFYIGTVWANFGDWLK